VRLRAVDPTKPRRLRKLVVEPLAVSPVGTWYVKKISPPVDLALNRLTGGRLTSLPLPTVFLTHKGARSGKERTSPLLYFSDGDEVVLMASNYGGERHPAWYHNVKANPEVRLRARGREGAYRARIATGEERDRLWELAKQYTRAYRRYEQIADHRTIQVVVCSPLDPA
jgi:deazaflavin-dependent oxidoreductase (nitroreductase family)